MARRAIRILVRTVSWFVGLMLLGVTSILFEGWHGEKSNCFLYQLKRWQADGGRIVIQWSHYWPGPHFLRLSADGHRVEEFVPDAPKQLHWIPPLFFAGHVETGWLTWDNHHVGEG